MVCAAVSLSSEYVLATTIVGVVFVRVEKSWCALVKFDVCALLLNTNTAFVRSD
jgi:hypothetical protein